MTVSKEKSDSEASGTCKSLELDAAGYRSRKYAVHRLIRPKRRSEDQNANRSYRRAGS